MITKRSSAPMLVCAILLLAVGLYEGCKNEDNTLLPYNPDTGGGPVSLTAIQVEDSVYVPRVSWGGGYVTALGVNRGNVARLDTSLLWLIHAASNGVHYQSKFGTTPAGTENLTTQLGGTPTTTLQEDQLYTFWIAREEIWSTITSNAGKILAADSTMSEASRISGDTLFLTSRSFEEKLNPIDLYIGIRNVTAVGRLGSIDVVQTNTSNAPIIRFHVTEAGAPDTLLANIGIASGNAYDVGSVVWEILAVDTTSGSDVFWTTDVIPPPIVAGQSVPGTRVFTAFPAAGLERNKTYYVWIADRLWDQRNRARTANFYASATFETF